MTTPNPHREALSELERLAKAATPGDWCERLDDDNEHRRLIGANINPDGSTKGDGMLNGGIYVVETKGPECKANAAFIAAANPAVVLGLLAERDALRAALEEAQGLLIECQEALIGRDDVCMDEDGNDAITAYRPAPAALEGSSLGEGLTGLLDVFERPFTDPDDPRLKCAQVLTKAEAEAVLEHRGNLIEALIPSSAADAKPVALLTEALEPFASKYARRLASHGAERDGKQIEHRLGDFRNAYEALKSTGAIND